MTERVRHTTSWARIKRITGDAKMMCTFANVAKNGFDMARFC